MPHSHAVKLSTCPNCGTDLSKAENYCPTCGQQNHDLNLTFGHLVEEVLEGIFHFDSKVWRTFRELIFKPGQLTLDFIAGRRASVVPPVRLYIFLSVVFFFLLGHQAERSGATHISFDYGTPKAGKGPISYSIGPTADRGHQPVDNSIAIDMGPHSSFTLTEADQANAPLMKRLAAGRTATLDSFLVRNHATPAWWLRLLVKRFARLKTAPAPEMEHTTFRNLSMGMFLLMPLFGYLLKLFNRRQRPLYVQSLIFSIHLHCFLFLLFSVMFLLDYVLPAGWSLFFLVPLVAATYWVTALRRFTGQGWGRTLWKSALLFGGYLGLLLIFMLSVAAVSLAMF